MLMYMQSAFGKTLFGVMAATLLAFAPAATLAAWEPDKQVEFIVPAGVGGSVDQTARQIQAIIVKHKLMQQDLVVVNKPAGAGAEGFLLLKNGNTEALKSPIRDDKVEPYRIMIASTSLFMTPLMTGVPFNWKDTRPVAMVALEPYIFWTNAEDHYKSAKEYIAAAKAAGRGKMKMAGIGAKQDAQLITVYLEQTTGAKFSYLPFKGANESFLRGEWGHVDSRILTPTEAASRWRAGELTAQCVFDKVRLPYTAKVTDQRQSWSGIPTCREAGIPAEHQSFRSILLPGQATPEQIAYFTEVLRKVTLTPEWKAYMEKGAFTPAFLTGPALNDWFVKREQFYKALSDCAFTIWEFRPPPLCPTSYPD